MLTLKFPVHCIHLRTLMCTNKQKPRLLQQLTIGALLLFWNIPDSKIRVFHQASWVQARQSDDVSNIFLVIIIIPDYSGEYAVNYK